MFQIKAKLLYNKRVKGNYFQLKAAMPKVVKEAWPGRFVNIRIGNGCQPLLRRPFSIHRIRGETVEIIYEVVGQATGLLAQKKTGEYVDIIGPLGNGFDFNVSIINGRQAILVAGGMGVAPLIFLAEKLAEIKNQKSPDKIVGIPTKCREKIKILVLIGARTKNEILCEREFQEIGCEVRVSTDDGSKGLKGKVTDLLKHLIPTTDYRLPTIYACGPQPMLKEIAFISKQYNIPAQISLEEHMACGIGACLGCAVNTKQGFKRACKDGPVFNADEIIW